MKNLHPGLSINGKARWPHSQRGSSRLLEFSLFFTFVAHGLAMLSMALLLLPGMPGGGTASDLERVNYIAGSPWLWRLGWVPWQVTALSDILLGAALVRTSWIPKLPALVTLVVTVVAVLPDQGGQLLWVTEGVRLAGEAARTGELTRYLEFEAAIFRLTAAWGALFYTLGALGWTWCFVSARIWNHTLTWLSLITWSTFAFVSLGPLLPADWSPASSLISAGNAAGFLLLQAWLALILELVLRRARPDVAHGRYAPWRSSRGGLIGRASNIIGNSRLLRYSCEFIPTPGFSSDITDVVYISYLVEASRLEKFVPEGLELQRLGPEGRYSLFTFLTYRHGNLGPTILGPLRRMLPSPVQTNWRIHVLDPQTGIRGIYFVTNGIDSALHALAARLMAEGMPMHLLRKGEVKAGSDGTISLLLDPGEGSAPDASARLGPSAIPVLPTPWRECFEDYRDFLAYCVPQDRALSSQPWRRCVTRQEIDLGIPLESCEPVEGQVESDFARAIIGSALPVCFRVAKVSFRFSREESRRIS